MGAHICSGMNLRAALDIARSLGCTIVPVNRTGEIRVSHPAMIQPVTINARRKDSERRFTGWLRELMRKMDFLRRNPLTP